MYGTFRLYHYLGYYQRPNKTWGITFKKLTAEGQLKMGVERNDDWQELLYELNESFLVLLLLADPYFYIYYQFTFVPRKYSFNVWVDSAYYLFLGQGLFGFSYHKKEL